MNRRKPDVMTFIVLEIFTDDEFMSMNENLFVKRRSVQLLLGENFPGKFPLTSVCVCVCVCV